MKDYQVNGVGVGKDPDLFERSQAYTEAFDRLGNSADNIKIIKNFISADEREVLLDLVEKSSPTSVDGRWGREDYRTVELSNYIDKYTDRALKQMSNSFELYLVPTAPFSLIKWAPGTEMPMHVDDLGDGHSHISGVIYLNDGYQGGEIGFPTHGISISPDAGDLIIFPGNLNYPHKVNMVVSGNRYTIPVWADIV
jgi:hypothetical protein